MKLFIVSLLAIASAVFFYLFLRPPLPIPDAVLVNVKNDLAGVFFVSSASEKSLKEKYAASKTGSAPVRILIVPGHDNTLTGAQFRNIRESDLTAELGGDLASFFADEPGFETVVTRGKNGEYAPDFASYFENQSSAILEFAQKYRSYMRSEISSGNISVYKGVPHIKVTQDGLIKLYGINKWADENKVDLVVHVHFNDYGSHPQNQPGDFTGFAVYVPEKQYSNSQASVAIARYIFNRLATYEAPSNQPKESAGIVPEQDLIAIGSNNSLDPAGMLIEYDYIYEPQFLYPETRRKKLEELAFQTYSGIKDFFDGATSTEKVYETTLLPHKWNFDLGDGIIGNVDVLSLQAALSESGVYPPPGFSKNECPITGVFKSCTAEAVRKFQQKSGINPSGYVGSQTRKALNALYAGQ